MKRHFNITKRNVIVKGIIFDLDGTLTQPTIDFQGMRRDLKLKPGEDILKTIELYKDKEQQKRAFEIIEKYETEANERLLLQPGFDKLMKYLDDIFIPRAIITRNSVKGINHFNERISKICKPFELALSRDFHPPKPAGDSIIHISKKWNIPTENLLMIGDHDIDIFTSKNAGAVSLFIHANEGYIPKSEPEFQVNDLLELFDWLKSYEEIDSSKNL